ncbi:hypothetical protein EXU57_22695 [Segetibacter sp. 3557_3]|uniref:hypothetical protein n=1 Tax=Segetibacter sp. 3557_3 TaxID=2547429 RepID=UPI001058F485|nr:hypothetical protein [Segetibacter sp. 3557_3]TDH19716.1 hypothetical protein EXU57_22695 [Segetibacter sp. 3557_3]
MKTLIIEIKDKAKNEFILELLGSFKYLNVIDKKDLKNADRKLVKKYKKAFNETENVPGLKKLKIPTEAIRTEL